MSVQENHVEEEYVDVEWSAKYFGVSKVTIYNWMKREENPHPAGRLIGPRTRRIPKREIIAFGERSMSQGESHRSAELRKRMGGDS